MSVERLGRGPTPRARRFEHTADLVARTPSASGDTIQRALQRGVWSAKLSVRVTRRRAYVYTTPPLNFHLCFYALCFIRCS